MLVCQLCGEFKIIDGKRVNMIIATWDDVGAHVQMRHKGVKQVSIRLVEEERT